jgi:hypothetical protein
MMSVGLKGDLGTLEPNWKIGGVETGGCVAVMKGFPDGIGVIVETEAAEPNWKGRLAFGAGAEEELRKGLKGFSGCCAACLGDPEGTAG